MGRPGVQVLVDKVGARLGAIGVTPNWITLAGLAVNVVPMLLLADGQFIPAVAVGLAGSFMDIFDGAVAKARGGGTRRGALFDAVADRISEAMYMGGIAWYLAVNQSPRLAVLPLAVLTSAYLISYIRAKAAEYGFSAHVGLMERAERLMLIGIMAILQTWWNVIPPFLWAMLGLNLLTVFQRFWVVWRQGTAEPPLPMEEIRIFPEWKDFRSHLAASGEEADEQSIRRAWELQRAEWSQRRERALARREAIKDENRRVRARLRADLRTQRRVRTRSHVRRERTRRP